jgi:hypothetical protein
MTGHIEIHLEVLVSISILSDFCIFSFCTRLYEELSSEDSRLRIGTKSLQFLKKIITNFLSYCRMLMIFFEGSRWRWKWRLLAGVHHVLEF